MSIYQREDDLDRYLVQLKGILMKMESHTESVQMERYSEAVLIYERVKCAETAYIEQIDQLQTKSKLSQLKRLEEKQQIMDDLKKKLESLKLVVDDNQLNAMDRGENLQNIPYNTKLIVWGNELQDKTQESINRIRDLTVESERIGMDVTADLEQQNESLNRVKTTINDVDENILHAKTTLRSIAKSVLRDKFTIAMIVIIIVLTIAIVLLVYANKSKEQKAKETLKNVLLELGTS